MKLLSYGLDHRMEPRLAFSLNGQVIDVMRASLWMKEHRQAIDYLSLPSSMSLALQDWGRSFSLLKQLKEAFESLDAGSLSIFDRPVALPENEVAFFAPIPDPPSLRFFQALTSPSASGFNFGNTQTLFGQGQAQPYPGLTTQGELAVILAGNRDGTDLKIAGYSIVNNWVDVQVSDAESDGNSGHSRGIATSMGPYLVTADDVEAHKLGHGFSLDMQIRVNGNVAGEGRFRDMAISFPDMIRQASKTRVQAGDIICSGSPVLLSNSPCPETGDLIEVEIQVLGCLANRVQSSGL